ncbi:MAG: hypothetical protein OEQ39_24320 [Gammaproteobacteria bacterium]|nr:hypothetical protein [Gammaproteobacteria bacterium]MDH3466582.1 hypothetical protein [Gammaproteobacteria bacterium]
MKSIFSTLAIVTMTASLLWGQVGCTESGQEPVADDPALATPIPEGAIRGAVLETMNAGGYTYVLMETGEEQRWVAGREIPVQVGDVVQSTQGMPMANFESKSLNRTFDVVYFVDRLENMSVAMMPEGHPDTPMPEGHPSIDGAADVMSADVSVAELKPGQDIAWLYANKDTLAGQQVSLRGQVVKYNDGILGWNFIHIQDGSGDAADGNHDLTVTSKAATAMGETVVLTGTINLNKDFGAGYSFPVLMEGASITKE